MQLGWGIIMMKVYLEGLVGKYLVNVNQNKTTSAYITNIALKVPKTSMLEAIGSKRYSTKLLHVYNRVCSSEYA